jgi:hypothetical protein
MLFSNFQISKEEENCVFNISSALYVFFTSHVFIRPLISFCIMIHMEIDFVTHCHVVILLSEHHHHYQGQH